MEGERFSRYLASFPPSQKDGAGEEETFSQVAPCLCWGREVARQGKEASLESPAKDVQQCRGFSFGTGPPELRSSWKECVKTIKWRAILIVISHLIFGVVLFFLGTLVPLNCQKDAIKYIPVTCPPDWIGYQGHCYNLSREEKNWMQSQNDCISHNASLAKITNEVMEFLTMLTRHQVFWIGLKREKYQPWKWLYGENATLEVGGNGGDCAYLDDATANSGTCSVKHRYICQKKKDFM